MKNLWQHLPSIFPGTNSDFFLLQLSVQFAAGIQRKNKFYNMTDLISLAKKKNKQVGVYPIAEDSWIDVGQWSEYHKAIDRLV